MNVIRFISLVLIAVTCAACSPMIGQPGYGAYQETRIPRRHESPRYDTVPARYYAATRIPGGGISFFVDKTVAYSDPSELPEDAILATQLPSGKWVINGGQVPNGIVTTTPPPVVYGRGYRPGTFAGLGAPFPGMSASLATIILADVDKGRNPCESTSQWKEVSVTGFLAGLATFALTGDPSIAAGLGLFSALGVSGNSQWNCELHKRFRWSLMATIDAGQPRCLDTLKQRRVNGKLDETLTRQCAVIEQKNFKRIDDAVATPAAASAPVRAIRETPVRLRDATPEKPPK